MATFHGPVDVMYFTAILLSKQKTFM